jgi:hypothetical protein
MHHDVRVPNVDELRRQRLRAEGLGATLLYDRSDDTDEPLYALADPAGHPFWLLVGERAVTSRWCAAKRCVATGSANA